MLSLFNTGYGLQDQLDGVKNGIAIVSTGNTHIAITSGQYVYIQDNSTLAEGLYRATANIAANGTLSGSNVTAVSGGGLNALNSKIDSYKITGSIGNNASKSFDFDWHNNLAVIFIGRGSGNRAGLYYVDADGGVVTVSACTDVTVTYSNNAFTISNSGATVYYRIINY